MRMGPVAVSQDRNTKLSIAIAEQKCSIARHAAAVREVAFAAPFIHPPCETESGGRFAPNSFDRSFEFLVLACKHLIKQFLADDLLALNSSAVQIHDQPVSLVDHRSVHKTRGPYRGL